MKTSMALRMGGESWPFVRLKFSKKNYGMPRPETAMAPVYTPEDAAKLNAYHDDLLLAEDGDCEAIERVAGFRHPEPVGWEPMGDTMGRLEWEAEGDLLCDRKALAGVMSDRVVTVECKGKVFKGLVTLVEESYIGPHRLKLSLFGAV